MCIGAYFAHGTVGQDVSQSWAQRGLDRNGLGGTRVVKGHGTVIWPMVENCRELSLELMSFDVAPQQDLYTRQGVAVTVEAVAQIKVRSDQASILTAAEQFLTKPQQQREG